MHKIHFSLGATVGILAGLLTLVAISQPAAAIENSDIAIEQNDRRLSVTVENPTGDPLQWQYIRGIPLTDCNENLLDELSDIPADAITGNQVSLTVTTPTLSYCFKITNETEGKAAWRAYQPAPLSDQDGPVISVERNRANDLLTIASRSPDLDSGSWRYASFAHEPICAEENVNTQPNRRSNSFSLALRETDNDRWYCFKARDTLGNTSYEKYLVTGVDATPPEVVIAQDGRLLTGTLAEDEQVNWSHVFSPSDIECNSNTFLNNRSARVGEQVILTDDRIDYYYCFRAEDDSGNAGFAKYKVESVDFLIPKISLQKTNLALEATSDRPIESWHYLKTATAVDCDSEADFDSAVDFSNNRLIKLEAADHEQYFCVRGINASNIAGYATIKIDAHAPQVSLQADQQSITATADKENLRWRYLKTEAELACDHSDAEQFEALNDNRYEGNESQLNKLDNGFWFCFQAADTGGNFGYAKTQVADVITEPPGEAGGSNSQRDVIILTAVLTLGLGAGFTYAIFKRRNGTEEPEPEKDATVRRKQPLLGKIKKKAKEPSPVDETVIQPLDYLKKDKDEES